MIGLAALALAHAAGMTALAPAKDAAPEVLARANKWEVNYDRDACHLLAQFGDEKNPLILRMTSYEPGDWYRLGLYGRRVTVRYPTSKIRVDFGLSDKPLERETINGTVGSYGAMWATTRLDGWERSNPDEQSPDLTAEQIARVSGVTVWVDRRKPFRLEFGPMTQPLAQMHLCQTELLKSWGYDPAVQMHLQRPVRASTPVLSWLGPSDYPMGALNTRHNGVVMFRLDVTEQGKINDCYVLERTNPEDFADLTCQLVRRRAKLSPALDALGQPVRSFYMARIVWRIGS